jgi:hypothetical protein
MRLEVPYVLVVEKHPSQVQEIVSKLRKGKSMHRSSREEDLQWFYNWCVRIDGGVVHTQPDQEDQAVEDFVERARVHLYAVKGRWWGASDHLPTVPVEVRNHFRAGWRKWKAEREAFESLPEEEKQRSFQEALGSLVGTPGFSMLFVK